MKIKKYKKAWQLLSDPARWCKGPEAVDKNGHECDSQSGRACQWCLFGAVRMIYGRGEAFDHAWQQLKTVLEIKKSPIRFNESKRTTHAKVLAALKTADV